MTALNISTDIPSNIDTLEKLAYWVCSALAHSNPGLTVVEGQGYNELACQAGVYYVPSDNKYRFLGRISMEVDKNHLAGSSKPWAFAKNLSTNALDASFKSN